MTTQPRKGFVRVEPKRERTYDAFDDSDCIVSWPDDFKPTLEQCERVALLMGFPIMPEGLRPPYYLEALRNLHALVQRSLSGDDDATKILVILQERYGEIQ